MKIRGRIQYRVAGKAFIALSLFDYRRYQPVITDADNEERMSISWFGLWNLVRIKYMNIEILDFYLSI